MAETAAYARRGFKGGVKATNLSGSINDSATTIACADLSTWAGVITNGPARATFNRNKADAEEIEFTGISGNNLTGVTRGVGGTTAQAHAATATVEHTSSVRDFDEANRAVKLLGANPAQGSVDLTTLLSGVTQNVKGFGAVGDGVADDASAIQAAISALPVGGGIVYFPVGTYRVASQVNVPANTAMIGAGIDLTTVKAGAANISTLRVNNGADNVIVRDMTISGNRATHAGTAAAFGAGGGNDDLRLERVKVTNGQSFSVFLDSAAGSYNRTRMIECIFEDSGGGYDTVGSGALNDCIFLGCIFRNTSGQGFATTNSTGGLLFDACEFIGPMGNGISLEPAQNVWIVNCTFRDLNDVAIGVYAHPIATIGGVDPTNISILGCRFYNTGAVSGNKCDHAVILDNTLESTVAGNTIRRMGRFGIVLRTVSTSGSGNILRNVLVNSNTIVDCNQDNAASTAVLGVQHGVGTLEKVTVRGNILRRQNTSESFSTHGILETGTPTDNIYEGNDVRGNVTAGIATTGTGSTVRLNVGHDTAPTSTTDLRTALINLGLYPAGGATPLDLNGGAFVAGSNADIGSTPRVKVLGFSNSNSTALVELGDGTGAVYFRIIRSIGNAWTMKASSALIMDEGLHLQFGTATGTKIGTGPIQKLGFFGATPIVQPSANANTSGATLAQLETEVNELKATIRSLGLLAT